MKHEIIKKLKDAGITDGLVLEGCFSDVTPKEMCARIDAAIARRGEQINVLMQIMSEHYGEAIDETPV